MPSFRHVPSKANFSEGGSGGLNSSFRVCRLRPRRVGCSHEFHSYARHPASCLRNALSHRVIRFVARLTQVCSWRSQVYASPVNPARRSGLDIVSGRLRNGFSSDHAMRSCRSHQVRVVGIHALNFIAFRVQRTLPHPSCQ